MAEIERKAVVLLSGGLDSATTMALAREMGFSLHALSFSYGQRHARELDFAKKVAAALGAVQHLVLRLDLDKIGGSALTGSCEVPKGRDTGEMAAGIPVTYVPARNTVFLAHALAWAEVLGARDIFIGANAVDYSGYPDCRPEFIAAFEKLANLATRAGVDADGRAFRVHAPLISLSKAQIILQGTRLGLDFGLTHSCYDPAPDGKACGACDSCLLRKKGFAEAGVADPTAYA
ncbi:MAG: 7-cyano-7-deazaguanine synthase QueC [Thermodesulfobacteriota bacterium]